MQQHFNTPTPPQIAFPEPAQTITEGILWAIVLGFVVYGVIEVRRSRSPLCLIMLLGGAIALFNEAIDDILGLVNHPVEGQHTVLDTFARVPMWGLPTYIIFFGGMSYLLLRELQRLRFTRRAFWIGIALTFVLDLLIELPLLRAGLYTYFSHDDVSLPMSIGGFPLYWLLINSTGPVLAAAIIFSVPGYFRGWRAPLIVLVPLVTDAACSAAVGLPIYSALYAPSATTPVLWAAAAVSCGIGFVLLDAFARWIEHATQRARRALEEQAAAGSVPSASPVETAPAARFVLVPEARALAD